MRALPRCVGWTVAWAWLVAGCAAPVVTVRHVLPAALPIPADITTLQVQGFSVEPAPDAELAAFAAGRLKEHLAKVRPAGGAAADSQPAGVANVSGTIHIEAADAEGTRRVRRWDRKTRQYQDQEIATLIRTADVAVTFVLTRLAGGENLGAVETRRSYRSAADPRVRGALGLEPPDSPEHVPPTEQVVRELLVECIDTFCQMVRPVELVVDVPLRAAGGSSGAAGMAAVREGDLPAAAEQFEAALRRAPDDANARFNLAAVSEAAGKLDAARKHYQGVLKQNSGSDPTAEEALKRIERVMAWRRGPTTREGRAP